MSAYKICVYAISKNEEQFVDRWMDAVSEADLVVVADTGSTDHTVERLRARGAVVYEENIDPWRFDTARNTALSHLPEDTDICVSNDLDEVFEKGWRQKLEQAWAPEYTRAKYWFAWSHHPDGSIHKRFSMEKIHRRHNFQWVRPVHEILEYSGSKPDQTVVIDDLILHHYPDDSKPRSQYLPLLELSVKENPQDDRAAFWLGREYTFYDRYEDAARVMENYLKLPSAKWPEERSAAMRILSDASLKRGDALSARNWLFKAAAECSYTRESWLAMARFGYQQEDWPLTFFAVEKGLSIASQTNSYLMDPAAWGYLLYDLGAISCYRLGMYEKSHTHALAALKYKPDDERLKNNAALIRAKLEDQ